MYHINNNKQNHIYWYVQEKRTHLALVPLIPNKNKNRRSKTSTGFLASKWRVLTAKISWSTYDKSANPSPLTTTGWFNGYQKKTPCRETWYKKRHIRWCFIWVIWFWNRSLTLHLLILLAYDIAAIFSKQLFVFSPISLKISTSTPSHDLLFTIIGVWGYWQRVANIYNQNSNSITWFVTPRQPHRNHCHESWVSTSTSNNLYIDMS